MSQSPVFRGNMEYGWLCLSCLQGTRGCQVLSNSSRSIFSYKEAVIFMFTLVSSRELQVPISPGGASCHRLTALAGSAAGERSRHGSGSQQHKAATTQGRTEPSSCTVFADTPEALNNCWRGKAQILLTNTS